MKFKLATDIFWVYIVTLFVVPIYSVVMGFLSPDPMFALTSSVFLAASLGIILYVWRIDYLSVITISEWGVSVSCFGKVFFHAKWEDITVGKFQKVVTRYQTEKSATQYAYFSTIPIDLTDKRTYEDGIRPTTKRMKGKTVFLTLTKAAEAQLDKCAPEPVYDYGYIIPKYFS